MPLKKNRSKSADIKTFRLECVDQNVFRSGFSNQNIFYSDSDNQTFLAQNTPIKSFHLKFALIEICQSFYFYIFITIVP